MMTVSIATLTNKVKERINNLDSSISDSMIEGYLEDSLQDVQNYTGDSINKDDVGGKYQNILINLACSYTLSYQMGVGVDFNITQGEFSISRGQESQVRNTQLQHHINMAEKSMRNIGRRIKYKKVMG